MWSQYQQQPAAGVALASGTEVAVCTTQPSNPPPGPFVIRGYFNATGGATGGGWSVKVRRGSGVAGAQVGSTQTVTFAATTTVSAPYYFFDPTPPAGGNAVYTLTLTAAGSAGTGNDSSVEVVNPTPYGSDE